jgi:hypothetical protein
MARLLNSQQNPRKGSVMQIETLLSDKGKEALNSVKKVIEPLWEPGKGSNWRPPDVDRRLTWALSKKEDQLVISVLAEQEDSWATRQAKELEKLFPESVVWTTTGEAQSSYPDTGYAPHAVSREIRPGVSIGHGRFRAGTLGCLVNVPGAQRDKIGLLTAAHVVALNESVSKGDRIYSPGKPEIGTLTHEDVIGRLDNFVDLMPIFDYSPGQDIFQSIDIAFVRIEDTDRKVPKWNEVPNPSDPDNKSIRIRSVVSEKDMPNFLNQKVYKFGRTTGFTVGKLVHHHIAQREIKLPNNKLYLYTEIFGVTAAASGDKFSRPGDSGAAVYTEEGGLLGFVIGADDSTTLCCMAERSLAAMKAQLVIGAKGT